MTIAWVVGGGGLLGSALTCALRSNGTELFSSSERLRWDNLPELALQLIASVEAFAARIGISGRWEIYWAAGVGNMSSSESELALETRVLSLILHLIESEPRLMSTPGALTFASSAGAIYAGSAENIISENTLTTPTTVYAREKLRQEDLVRTFAQTSRRTTALIARISTLYGPGQSLGKNQGLISHIARSILRNQPIQIYVPFDTIRDYIAAADAASAMISVLRARSEKPGVLIKIIASEQPTTIAEIISVFKRITRRPPKIITSANKLSSLYSRRVQFKSIVAPECTQSPKICLLVGIAQVMAAERAAFLRGSGAQARK